MDLGEFLVNMIRRIDQLEKEVAELKEAARPENIQTKKDQEHIKGISIPFEIVAIRDTRQE